jgi:hypothetical protein
MSKFDLAGIAFLAWCSIGFIGALWISVEFCADPYDNGFPIARRIRRLVLG